MISAEFLDSIHSENIKILKDEPMNCHTSFRIGGKADLFCETESIDALKQVILACKKYNIPYFILGLGSNILVSDDGICGVVIKLNGEFNKILSLEDDIIQCGAGVTLAGLCVYARKKSLSGLEFAWGIPGSVGGAIYMNAGAYGGEIKNILISSTYMDTDGNIFSINNEEHNFSYRSSIYSNKNYIILNAKFKLKQEHQENIMCRMDELMNKRKSKQPLNRPSAGSVFKRPEGYYAAALIEECGLKGYSVGDAQVSEKHSGFIVNNGKATAEDVKKLVEHIKKTVKDKKGVTLCCEIKYIE